MDFAVTLGASGGQYGTIKSDLAGLGFIAESNRLVRKFGNIQVYLDFLTDDPPSQTGTRLVDDLVASVKPGVNREGLRDGLLAVWTKKNVKGSCADDRQGEGRARPNVGAMRLEPGFGWEFIEPRG